MYFYEEMILQMLKNWKIIFKYNIEKLIKIYENTKTVLDLLYFRFYCFLINNIYSNNWIKLQSGLLHGEYAAITIIKKGLYSDSNPN